MGCGRSRGTDNSLGLAEGALWALWEVVEDAA